MRHTTTFARRTAALFLAVVLSLPTVYAAAGERKLKTSTRIVDGLTYANTVTVNASNRVESFSLELSPDSAVRPILLQGSGRIYGGGSIKKAVAAAQEMGYHVLGAVNTDFFSMSTGVPIGIVIEDGIYRSSPENEAAILISDGQIALCEDPSVSLTLTDRTSGAVTEIHHLNKVRNASGGLYLYDRSFSDTAHTTAPGWYVRLRPAGAGGDPWLFGSGAPSSSASGGTLPALTVNSVTELEVAEVGYTQENIPIGEDEYVLTAADGSGYAEVLQSFQVGGRATLTAACKDPALAQAQWAGGVGDVMIRDGAVTNSSSWTYRNDGRNPRTALGVKGDGTVLLYAVDGRQAGYSSGLSQMDLAEELLAQGCRWAVNLDGGGSTALSAWLPGRTGPAVCSSPSGGSLRACATYMLLVAPGAGDGEPDRLAWKEDGLVVLTGSSLPLPETAVLDSGLDLLSGALPADLTVTPETGLGTIRDGIYTAGDRAGTETVRLSSQRLGVEGEATIHVVDALTELTVTRAGSQTALSALTVKPGETVRLSVTGSYWGREALRDLPAVSWTVEGNVGAVDETGTFTASAGGQAGTIRVSAGGLTRSIPVTLTNVHNDVPEGDWAYDAVEFCYNRGIVSGVSTTEFGRNYSIGRGDFALMLYKALGRPAVSSPCTFTDVAKTDYYYAALAWAQETGLISGVGDGRYAPRDPVTREQAFTVLRQIMPKLGKDCPDGSLSVLDRFADKDQIAGYAKAHAATLVAQGIVGGRGDGIAPKGVLTRAEMAALLYKVMTYTPILDVPTDPVEPADPAGPDAPQGVLTISQSREELKSAESAILTAALEPAAEGAAVSWSSSDPSVATVSPTGTVTNISPRREAADVTVTASCNGLTASCTIRCQPARRVGTVTDTKVGLNIRSGPGTEHAIAGRLADGGRVVVLGGQEGWYQILYRTENDQAALGYVSSGYLVLDEGET